MEEVVRRSLDDLIYAQTEEKVESAVTIEFTIDGESFKIDLTEDNAALFHETIKPFRDAAQSVTKKSGQRKKAPSAGAAATSSVGGGGKKPTSSDDKLNKDIREWANSEGGFDLSARGRIPSHVREAYFAAKGGTPEGAVSEDKLTDETPPLNFTSENGESGSGGESVEAPNADAANVSETV